MNELGILEEQSILISIKRKIGMAVSYTYYDPDILVEINTALATLFQIGAGKKNFRIHASDETWSELEESVGLRNPETIDLIKDYVYLSAKIVFDPPEGSAHMEALKSRKDELEWRIFYFEDEWPNGTGG